MSDREFIAVFHYDNGGTNRCGAEPYRYAEEIVRCKECKHRINDDDFQEKHICLLRRANGGKFCKDDDFCSYGERREP